MADANELISFISQMTGESNLRVEENLGSGFVRLRVSEAERRQAKHDIQRVEDIVIEMLRNSRDAGAGSVYLATSKSDGVRTVVVIDDGSGVPDGMRERIFDARVTSKLDSIHMDRWGVHGRGMALFSIREMCDEARVVASGAGLGSSIMASVDTARLPERADQSTWPSLIREDDGSRILGSGPHNIVRCACEFALEELHGCEVFLGSPSEIAATLLARARGRVDASRLLFIDDESELPVADRLALADDAPELMRIAGSIGLDISERTAHRILSGAIAPVRSVASRLLRERSDAGAPREVDLAQDRRGLKISRDDIDAFSRDLERDFGRLAERYYLTLAAEPRVRVSRDKITVTFEVSKGE